MPLDELAARVDAEDVDEESISLSLHYLAEEGAIVRQEDVMWSGRVWVPPDADAVLDELAATDEGLSKRGREAINKIRKIGSEEYKAPTWAGYFDIEPPALEQVLLELNRRDVIGLAAWRFALHLQRVAHARPRWDAIAQLCDTRMTTVSNLSKAARAYSKQGGACRRAVLLRYLGLDAADSCGRCDVCDPGLPRPWQARSLRIENLRDALPAAAIVRAMLYEAGGRFSQRSIKHALAGSTGGGRYPISSHLVEHRLFGYLSALGVDGVETTVETLIGIGQVEVLSVQRDGGPAYQSWKLTGAGSALT
jgi:hypothetical protein